MTLLAYLYILCVCVCVYTYTVTNTWCHLANDIARRHIIDIDIIQHSIYHTVCLILYASDICIPQLYKNEQYYVTTFMHNVTLLTISFSSVFCSHCEHVLNCY
jgi:hypothetical protein